MGPAMVSGCYGCAQDTAKRQQAALKFADFGMENGIAVIRVSEARHGHAVTLLSTLAHEMIHLHQHRRRLDRGGNHKSDFRQRAARICAVHGFDPKTF